MKKIEKLTPEQEALIPVIRDKWLKRFADGWVDKDKAEKQIKWLYRFCKLDEPKVWYVDSPMMAQIIANLLSSGEIKEYLSGANVWANVGANVRDNVGANVRDNVRANVWANVGANVRDNVRDNVWANVRDNVWDNVRANVRDNVGANGKLEWKEFSQYGSCSDYGWVALYDYFDTIGFELENPHFNEFRELLWSGVYDMIQFEKVCIVVSLPISIKRDNRQRLHSTKGAAITFRDGYSQWYWKGTYVPQHWIEQPDTITLEECKTDNAERRRVLIEILGVDAYFKKIGADNVKVIDEGIDNQNLPMRLLEFDFEGRKIQMLECVCPSTNRVYNIPPPNQQSRNCWDAKASTFKITEQECKLLTIES